MKTVSILCRRWFEKINGNTYFSARTFLNGELVSRIPFRYGYGEQCLWEAMVAAVNDCPSLPPTKPHEGPRSWAERTGIALVADIVDVQRKKDL